MQQVVGLVLTAVFLVSEGTSFHSCIGASRRSRRRGPYAAASPGDPTHTPAPSDEKNFRYVEGLIENLGRQVDKWVLSGNPTAEIRARNLLEQIENEAKDPELLKRAVILLRRAGLPIDERIRRSKKELGRTDDAQRRRDAEERRIWESSRAEICDNSDPKSNVRSALGKRDTSRTKPDIVTRSVIDPESVAKDFVSLQNELAKPTGSPSEIFASVSASVEGPSRASVRVAELVAKAGSGANFHGEFLGIGGLDDVLSQFKRRVWTPLAAPPQLLQELGIHPVRGVLLYGKPGCGKTLIARQLGQLLSPLRPITVVSGPEIMDKFVGSSEKNLREVFDSPPDIYDFYRIGESDGGDSIARSAIHVIVLDEFDAIARTRGGRQGAGDQGDAGVARDSVVNQLLAKMDGVEPLAVPTLVVGLTNKRSLIEPALLRPGRFEVQIEVPPPRSMSQRISIVKVHTQNMQKAGRLLVKDAPTGSAASRHELAGDLLTYSELLAKLAGDCAGFSGASIAAVCRAAASHALERAVEEFTHDPRNSKLLNDCVVTRDDFDSAVADVVASQGDTDWSEDDGDSNDESTAAKEPAHG